MVKKAALEPATWFNPGSTTYQMCASIAVLAYEALIHIFNDSFEFFKSHKHKTKAIMRLLIFIVELSINGMLRSSKCFWFANLQQ